MAKFAVFSIVILGLTIVGCRANCGEIFERGELDEETKQEIVNKHNNLRSLIVSGFVPGYPKGKNLYALGWDDKLAAEAMKLVDACNGGRSFTATDERFNKVGQLITASASPGRKDGPDFYPIIQSWFDQYKTMTYPNIQNGYFTQVIWNDTQYIGCGYIHFRPTPNDWYSKDYLCLYGPGGNNYGMLPYEVA